MSIAVLFVVGALLLWFAATGKAGKVLTAITGGSETVPSTIPNPQPQDAPITPPGQQLPGQPSDFASLWSQGRAQPQYGSTWGGNPLLANNWWAMIGGNVTGTDPNGNMIVTLPDGTSWLAGTPTGGAVI